MRVALRLSLWQIRSSGMRTTGLAVYRMQALLLELDLAGRIEWSSGQLVALKA